MELSVYVDGKFYPQSEAKVSVFDHGLLYGDGVFEGIRAYNRRIFKLERHIDRLYHSAKAIDTGWPRLRLRRLGERSEESAVRAADSPRFCRQEVGFSIASTTCIYFGYVLD